MRMTRTITKIMNEYIDRNIGFEEAKAGLMHLAFHPEAAEALLRSWEEYRPRLN